MDTFEDKSTVSKEDWNMQWKLYQDVESYPDTKSVVKRLLRKPRESNVLMKWKNDVCVLMQVGFGQRFCLNDYITRHPFLRIQTIITNPDKARQKLATTFISDLIQTCQAYEPAYCLEIQSIITQEGLHFAKSLPGWYPKGDSFWYCCHIPTST
jgi:hypothetical protein